MSPRLVSRSATPLTGPRPHLWKRTACLAVAIALLALPVSVLADDAEAAGPVTAVVIAPVDVSDFVWNGRLAADYIAPVVVRAAFDPTVQAAMLRDHFLIEHPEVRD